DRLYHLVRGQDTRRVARDEVVKSISSETTFDTDTADRDLLEGHIWRLAETVADRAKAKGLSGRSVTLKLKRADFTLVTRRHSLDRPTQSADRLWREAQGLLAALPDPGPFRLIGVGLSDLTPGAAPEEGDLLDPGARTR
ncbi:hypothetical protein, partial [Aphanothece microscopica]|uniref:DinB/UmuC family translesion DNA polymerase n=1 Tax=Aphanothece microscopica TaxID=1049561 RepID=UPI00398496DB